MYGEPDAATKCFGSWRGACTHIGNAITSWTIKHLAWPPRSFKHAGAPHTWSCFSRTVKPSTSQTLKSIFALGAAWQSRRADIGPGMHEAPPGHPLFFYITASLPLHGNTCEENAAWHFAWVSKLEQKASSQVGTDWLLFGAFQRCWKHAAPSKQGAPSNNDM